MSVRGRRGLAIQPPSGRVLHFVRHGQYESGDLGSGGLTALGRTQALRLARHFDALSITSLLSSDFRRAVETTQLLAKELGMVHTKRHRLLREVIPTTVPGFDVPSDKRREHAGRVERIVQRFFKTSRQPRQDVIVCHGNLIRALLMRVTSGHLDGWYRFSIHHASVTSFAISGGEIKVIGFDLIEHLPLRMRTYE